MMSVLDALGLEINDFVLSAPLWAVFVIASIAFALMYFSMAGLGFFWSRLLAPRMKLGRRLDPRPLFSGQVGFEIRYSLISVLIFGGYGLLQVYLIRKQLITVDFNLYHFGSILFDLTLFFVWNEVHFYCVHRLLHWKPLFDRVHYIHHRSTTPTPFSTYSFHWFEALALSSVMIFVLPFHTFNIGAIIVFPLISIAFNVIGHLNYSILSDRPINHFAQASARHALHHHYYKGNYGFTLPWLDQLFETDLKLKKKI